MHKIISVGDIQICPKSYKVIGDIFNNHLLPIIKESKPHTVIFPGDLFEFANYTNNYVSAAEVIKPLSNLFYEITSMGIEILIVDGNHDKTYGDFANSNDIFKHRLIVHASNSVMVHDCDEISFIMVPWLLPHQYNRKELIADIKDKATFAKINKKTPFLVGHMRIVGAQDSMYEVKESSHDFCFTKEEVSEMNIDYGTLGDIHKYQRVVKEIFYLGSIRQRHFGEIDNPTIFRTTIIDKENGNEDWFTEINDVPKHYIFTAKDETGLSDILNNYTFLEENQYRIDINFETSVKSKRKNVQIRNKYTKPSTSKLSQSIEKISFETNKLLKLYNDYAKILTNEELEESIKLHDTQDKN